LDTLFSSTTTPTTELYTLSLHDALPILRITLRRPSRPIMTTATAAVTIPNRSWTVDWASICAVTPPRSAPAAVATSSTMPSRRRSEEHTSELQSRGHLVCRLLLEKKKT